MKQILITGGTGFFGKALTYLALQSPAERICIYSRNEHNQHLMRGEFNDNPRLRFFIGDVRDRDRLRRAMQGVEAVCHAAALKRIEVGRYNASEMTKTNIQGSMNVIEASIDAEVQKVLLISSDKAFEPISPYGQSKALAESLFMNANEAQRGRGPKFAACRWGNVFCSTGSIVPTWRAILKSRNIVPVTDPEATRFFMRVDEAAELAMDTLETMQGGELIIPTLPAFRLADLAEAMGANMRITGLPEYEKLHESMEHGNSSDLARRMSVMELREALNNV